MTVDTTPTKPACTEAMGTQRRSGGAAIGHKAKHLPTERIGYVVTYYDNGDLLVSVDGKYERWPVADTLGLGRR